VAAAPLVERKRLAAFLVSLRHQELAEYQTRMARKIGDDPFAMSDAEDFDDTSRTNWMKTLLH
jgi:hypothetical protein